MDSPPPSPLPAPTVLPDRKSARAAMAAFAVAILALLAVRTYQPRLSAKPTESAGGATVVVDLNTAGRAELLQVPGVGPNLADAILNHRAASGPFTRVEELEAVRGVGGKTLAKLRPFVTVGEVASSADSEPVEKLERKPIAAPPPPAPMTSGGKIKPGEPPIDVNAATATELQRLPGVGPVLAQKIVEIREEKRFATVDELRRVPRLGVKTLEGLRKFVTVGK